MFRGSLRPADSHNTELRTVCCTVTTFLTLHSPASPDILRLVSAFTTPHRGLCQGQMVLYIRLRRYSPEKLLQSGHTHSLTDASLFTENRFILDPTVVGPKRGVRTRQYSTARRLLAISQVERANIDSMHCMESKKITSNLEWLVIIKLNNAVWGSLRTLS